MVHEAGVVVYDFAGKVRRTFALTPRQAQGEPHFDPTGAHLILLGQGEIEIVDLVAMTSRPIARGIEGVVGGSEDGSVFGYVDADGLAHVLGGDGKELRTLRPTNRPHTLVFSPTGDRIGALAETDLVVHDTKGKAIASVPVEVAADDRRSSAVMTSGSGVGMASSSTSGRAR